MEAFRTDLTNLIARDEHVVVCGAGHISMPLITLFKMLDMQVTVIDDRPEFAENAKERGADEVLCMPFAEAFSKIEGDEDTYFVVVTRGHRYDTDCVGAALLKKHAYVGMIGSSRHAKIVRETLLKEGISEELIDSIYTPIGLDIGAETPEEIAIAIAAEIIEIKNKKEKNYGFPRDIVNAIKEAGREPMILATIVDKRGSAPRAAGAKMLVRSDESIVGTIGGGLGENEVIKYAADLLRDGYDGAEIKHIDMIAGADDDGMVCGGAIDVLLETV